MALTRKQKEEILKDLKEKVARQKAMVLVGITGLKVKDISALRTKLKAADGNLQVVKKTLIEKAFKENKLDFDKKNYKEELGLAFGFKDEVLPAQAVYRLGLENENFKILGGYVDGKFAEAEQIIALAQLPSKQELLAELIGSLKAPVSNFVYSLQYNLKGLVYILSTLKK